MTPAVTAEPTNTKTVNWQEDFRLKADLRQKDVYAYESELRVLEKSAPSLENILSRAFQIMRSLGMNIDSSIEAEHHLKAAIKAGWVEGPVCEIAEVSLNGTGKKTTRYLFDGENVDEMHPGKVRWYGRKIQDAFNAAVEPPDPN